MRVLGISWLGVAVDDVAPMRAFAHETLGLELDHEREDLVALRFANGDRLELFGPHGPRAPGQFDANEVVAGFLVDDLEQARAELAERRVPMGPIQVGGMIEVPAAALVAGLFGRRLDFLSIGTNDLIQYTLAIDRTDHAVSSLYDPYHPAVLRLIGQTIRAAKRAGKPVAVCGEMAGDIEATRLLLGLGLTQFSMHASSLLRVKREVLASRVGELAPKVARLIRSDDPLRVRSALQQLREAVAAADG